MSYWKIYGALAFVMVGLVTQSDVVTAQTSTRSVEQAPAVVAHSTDMSERGATLRFHLSNGESIVVSLSRGVVTLNRREIATYDSGGELDLAWRRLLAQAPEISPNEMQRLVHAWSVENLKEDTYQTLTAGLAQLGDPLAAPIEPPSVPRPARPPRTPGPTAGAQTQHSVLSGMASDIVGLLAAFVAMCSLGFGLVFFAPRQLEVVADTVRNSFWRSFFAGLFAQPLIVPIFGLLMLGLALTVVGILVIPFAAIAFAAAAVLGVLGGYLAVARSVGEAYLRQRMSQGHAVGGWLSYRYMVYGLGALFTIWLPAVLLGWAPVAGQIFTVSAILVSWIIATAGFGATILSRAGIRGTFTRQFDQSLSDEYLYRTPQATPVVFSRRHQDRFES